MAEVYLHVGMPKCGSSSIQTFLSSDVFRKEFDNKIHYIAIRSDGSILAKNAIVKQAKRSPHGYASSCDAVLVNNLSSSSQRDIASVLNSELDRGHNIILSNEGWGPRPQEFPDDHPIFSNLKGNIKVVAYMRPQVEWLNSAWWQWGAWSDVPFQRWINANKGKALWGCLVEQWAEKPWVNSVIPRLVCGDVVSDFMNLLGYPGVVAPSTNKSLSAPVLRFLQNHRKYRQGPHDSSIDFILSRRVNFPSGHTPWVIEPRLAKKLVSYYVEDNKKLSSYLESVQQELMLSDRKWWGDEPFAQKEVESPGPIAVSTADSEILACSLIDSILEMDKALRRHDK